MCDTRERRLIGLIDVDSHNFPNLCLMKLSSYHKSIGDVVEWWVNDKSKNYDIVYMSKVFGDEYTADVQEPENAKKVIKGGTGYAIKLENGKEVYHKELDPPLPFEIESVYPEKKGIKLYVNACKRIRGKWNWRNAKVFCLTNFDTTHEQDMQRISAIQECECQPYVMIYNKPSAPSITRRLQRWTNSTMLYAKTQDFMEYQRMNYKSVLEGSDEKRMRLVT